MSSLDTNHFLAVIPFILPFVTFCSVYDVSTSCTKIFILKYYHYNCVCFLKRTNPFFYKCSYLNSLYLLMNCTLILPYDLLLIEANIISFAFAPFSMNCKIILYGNAIS